MEKERPGPQSKPNAPGKGHNDAREKTSKKVLGVMSPPDSASESRGEDNGEAAHALYFAGTCGNQHGGAEERELTLLSQKAIEFGSHLKRTWKSGLSLMTNETRSVGKYVEGEVGGASTAVGRTDGKRDLRDLVEEQLEDRIALSLRQAHDATGEACQRWRYLSDTFFTGFRQTSGSVMAGEDRTDLRFRERDGEDGERTGGRCEDKEKFTWVDIDGFVAGNRVHTHNGVNGFDGLTPHCLTGSACAICLGDCAVYSIEALEVLLETRAERRVQRVPVAS